MTLKELKDRLNKMGHADHMPVTVMQEHEVRVNSIVQFESEVKDVAICRLGVVIIGQELLKPEGEE